MNKQSTKTVELTCLENKLSQGKPVIWFNPSWGHASVALKNSAFKKENFTEAVSNWRYFAPLLAKIFPETVITDGKIDSNFVQIDAFSQTDETLFVKCDHNLPGTGCIKARGGVYEILMQALSDYQGLRPDNPLILLSDDVKTHFSKRRIVVGSTGNLGFSVGIIARRLGYQVDVHMSHDAKAWKKNRLLEMGAKVHESTGDYSSAVSIARADSEKDSYSYFVDDENSPTLFLGYAAAAKDLAQQLTDLGIKVGPNNPLEVYLPCGVGGAPGGVAFGLTTLFGDNVRPILVEPVNSPSMLVQLLSGLDESVSVYDYGLSNQTDADGLAVARASMLVAREMSGIAYAVATVPDDDLFIWSEHMWRVYGMRLEPSAAAGFAAYFLHRKTLKQINNDLEPTRVIWTTGGSFLPPDEFEKILERGRSVSGTT
ncbi:MAG: D-serine ammonia-lyase [Rhizobiaceae bacterium]